MAYFFTLLFFISVIFLIIGLFVPNTALFWWKGTRTRKTSSVAYSVIMLVSVIATILTIPDEAKAEEEAKVAAQSKTSSTETEASSTETNASPTETNAAASNTPLDVEVSRGYDLAQNSDTSYSFNYDETVSLENKTGYIVCHSLGNHQDNGRLRKKWANVNGWYQERPDFEYRYERDYKNNHPGNIAVKIWRTDLQFNKKKGGWHGKLIVAPVGTEDTFLLDPFDFTLKDITQCSLLTKAKCRFLTLTKFETLSPEDYPRNMNGIRKIEIPEGALVL
ncbi:MAG TPA: hypothetical protein VK616_00100, partial [Flavitalea sp.]|nr:hypothetical protein [Flavitalea sp.]